MRNTKLLFALPLFAFGLVACGSKTPSELNVKVLGKDGTVMTEFNFGYTLNKDDVKVEAKFSQGEYSTISSDKWSSKVFGDKTSYTFTESDIGSKKIDVSYGGITKETNVTVALGVNFEAHFEIDDKPVQEVLGTTFTLNETKTVSVVLDNKYKKDWVEEVRFEEVLKQGQEKAVEITQKEDKYKIDVKGINIVTGEDSHTIKAFFKLKYEVEEQEIRLNFQVENKEGK